MSMNVFYSPNDDEKFANFAAPASPPCGAKYDQWKISHI